VSVPSIGDFYGVLIWRAGADVGVRTDAGALPLSYAALGAATGFEPVTSRLRGDNRRASTRTRPGSGVARAGRGCGSGCRNLPSGFTPTGIQDSHPRSQHARVRTSTARNVTEASAGIEPACRSFADWYLTTRSRDHASPAGLEPPMHKATVLPTAALPLCHRPAGCLSGVEPLLPEPQSGAFPRRQQAPVGDQGLEPRTDGM
jgi:hypothetical protein